MSGYAPLTDTTTGRVSHWKATNASAHVVSSNITTKFRDAFETYDPNTPTGNWTEAKATGDLVYVDGNAAAASYLVISKDPLSAGTETSVTGTNFVGMPIELAFGAHMSQRTLGQEFSVEIVDTGDLIPDTADIAIDTIAQTTTTITITTVNPHGLSVGRAIGIRGVLDSRVNYPALVVATVVSPNIFTVTAGPNGTIASLTAYTSTVLAATTAALPAYTGATTTLTASANGAFPAIDGVTIPLGGRVLVKNETSQQHNGVYTLTTVGSVSTAWVLTRAADYDTTAELTVVAGALFAVSVFVAGGATQSQKEYYLTATVTTVGTTNVVWADTGVTGPLGFVFIRQRLGRARNGISQIFENATATNSSFYIRSEAGDALPSGTISTNHSATIGTTASVQLAGAVPFSYSFSPTTEYRIFGQADRTQWVDSPVDSLAQTTSRAVRTQVCPDPSERYRIRIRANNSKSLTVPVAQIVSANKPTSATCTVTTDRPHGLVTGDLVVAYGTRLQTAATDFQNLTAASPVLSTPSATTFTITWGTASASNLTTYGGFIAKVNGGNLMSALGVSTSPVQTATLRTLSDGTRELTIVGLATYVGAAVIGDLVELVGVRDNTTGATLNIDGPWKVANIATTTLTLVLPFPGQRTLPADFATIAAPTACGGAVIRRTDFRLSFVRLFDYERERVELLPRPAGDLGSAAPVAIQGGTLPTVTTVGTVTTVTGVTTVSTVSAVTSANLGIPGIIADVASAALTTTTTTAAFTPTFGTAYSVSIPVTAVTGTSPTLDVSIEESDDSGTNWFKVYDFPRITAAGVYRSPLIRMVGNRIRYVQTVGGTTPSFTRAVNRLQSSSNSEPVRQLIDRALAINTLNSVVPATGGLDARDTGNRVQLVVNMGAITTTAPAFQIEGSDDNGGGWYSIGAPLTGVASSTVQLTVVDINAALLRVRVSTAGSGATLNSLTLKAHD